MIRGGIYYEAAPSSKERKGVIMSGRPVVLVSPRPWGDVVQVVPLTTSAKRRADGFPHHIPVRFGDEESVALCEQVRTVDRSYLRKWPIGVVSTQTLGEIDTQLKRILGLEGES